MTTASLFSHVAAPGTSTTSATPFIAAITAEVTQAGWWLDGYWWYAGTATAPQKFAAWCVTGGTAGGTGSKTATLIASSVVTSGTLTANSWNFVPLPGKMPMPVGTSLLFCTGLSIPGGGTFASAANQFGASGQPFHSGITSGPLFAYSDSTAGGAAGTTIPWGGWAQGLFSVAGSDPTQAANLPTTGSNANSFGIDPQVSTDAPAGFSGPYDPWALNVAADVAATVDIDSQYVVATEFWLSEACALSYIRYFSPRSAVRLATAADIWRISDQGNPVHVTPSWTGGGAAAGWQQVSLSGITLPPGKYKASVYNGNGAGGSGNGATAKSVGFFATGRGASNITWGPLTIPNVANASAATFLPGPGTGPGQGTYANPTTGPDQYPADYASAAPGQFYWVTVGVTPVTSGLLMASGLL